MRNENFKKLATALYLVTVTLFALAIGAALDAWLGMGTMVLAAAAAADRITEKKVAGLKSYPVKDGEKIFAGTLVAIQADGHALPAADAANLRVVGVATHTVDNSAGADGDLWVDVESDMLFKFGASSITQAMVGQMMYVVDDQTFDEAAGTNGVKAGRLVEFISTTSGWIHVQATGRGAVVANADATYGQPEADLINELKSIVNTLVS